MTNYTPARLKIKHTSLAAESKLIRKEEIKYRNRFRETRKEHFADIRADLHHHRITVVREECRATHIALAFIQGKPYAHVERELSDKGKRWLGLPKKTFDIAQKYGKWDTLDNTKARMIQWALEHPQLEYLREKDKKAA